MSVIGSVIVIGVGSPHGDDQFGWAVVDQLSEITNIPTKKISNPVDFVLELDAHKRVILVDAAKGLPQHVPFQKLDYANASHRQIIGALPSNTTHDLGLSSAIRMAESLGKLTDHIILWIGNASEFQSMSEITPATMHAAKACAAAIDSDCSP
jgi:hydrogenase maturation protease